MTHSPPTILLIEDNLGDVRLIREMLAESAGAGQVAPFRLIHVGRLADGLAALAQTSADVVLLDLSLPDSRGQDTFLRLRAAAPETPAVVLTGLGDEQTALRAIQAGAQDYLVKGQVDGNVLGRAVRYAIERQELTRALRRSEERYRLIVETAQEGVWQIDDDSRTTFVNRKMAGMLGYTVDEMAGASLFDFMDEEGLQIAAAQVERRRQGIAEQHDFKFRRKDGADLWAILSTNPLLGDDGRYLGALAMVADITERKQAEQRALELALERERMALLTKFILDVSHEFRTPLAIIQANVFLLERLEDPAKRGRKLAQIGEQVTGITRLVELLAEMARLDSGVPFTIQPTDLNGLIGAVAGKLGGAAAAKGLTLRLALAPDLPPVPADGDRLDKALHELLDNAVRYTPAGGNITVRTAGDADGVTVEVQDTGPGIPPEVLPHIFERFYRQDVAHTTPGFGLGLSIARAIVERHGGRLEVESQPGAGSVFRIKAARVDL